MRAFNSIDTVFHDVREVREAWADLYSSYLDLRLSTTEGGRIRQDKLKLLLQRMADHLGYRFLPYEHWVRLIKRAFFVLMIAVAFFGSTAWSEAAGEPDPGDLVSMLDHAAIVETMALACEDSRPDLAAAFKEAQQRWWVRNAEIHQTVASLEREIGTPRAKAFLDYFNSLRQSLQQQIQDQQHAGDAGYAARCDDVLEELTRGRLDYGPSGAPERAG